MYIQKLEESAMCKIEHISYSSDTLEYTNWTIFPQTADLSNIIIVLASKQQ